MGVVVRLGLLVATFLMSVPVLFFLSLTPLFVGSWFVDLFGDIHAGHLLPVFFGTLCLGGTVSIGRVRKAIPARRATVLLLVGGFFILTGTLLFGNVWEILQAEHHFATGRTYGAFRPMCAEFLPACLLREHHQYPNQVLESLIAGVVWYAGLVLWWKGNDERYWQ